MKITANPPSRERRGLSLALLAGATAGLLAGLPAGADDARPPARDEVQVLQAKYRTERDALVKTGADKRFLPHLLTNAEAIAKRADAALMTGRFLQAAAGYRQARWQLPYSPPAVPDHTARVFGDLRLRHSHEINAVAFSPDGSLLATGGRDRTVRVWDLANGHELLAYRGHPDTVRTLAFSPDGKLLASAGGEKDVRLWEPRTGKDVRVLPGQGQCRYVTSIAFAPDGKTLAAGCDDRALRLYDVATGALKRDITDFGQMVQSVAFSPDGTLLAAGVANGQMRLWEYPKVIEPGRNQPEFWAKQDESGTASHFVAFSPSSKQLLRLGPDGLKIYPVQVPGAPNVVTAPLRVIRHPGPPVKNKVHWFTCAVYSKDGKTLYTGGTDSLVRLWDIESGAPAGTFRGHNDEIRALAFSPSGDTLASASSDYTVRLWHFDIVLQARDYVGHKGAVWTAFFSPDGQRIVSASADQTAKVWDLASGRELHTLGHGAAVTTAAFSPDGKTVVTAGGDRTLRLWDAGTGKPLRALEGHKATVTSAEFSPDGKRLVSGSADRHVKVWDAGTGKELLDLDTGSVVAAVGFSSDGKQVAAGTVDAMVRLWDVATGKPGRAWPAHYAAVSALAFSPDGRLLATCGADQLVRVWKLDALDAAPITLTGHTGPLSSVAFRRDGQLLASGGADGVVKLWRLDGGGAKEAQNFRGHRDWVTNVAFSKDGFYVVSASVDRTVKMWEVTSKELALQAEHTGSVDAVAVSPDGKLIASGASDRTIKLWDRATGLEVLTIPGHPAAVLALAFSPDGKTLASGGADRAIRLWDVKTGKELPRQEAHDLNMKDLLNPPGLLQFTADGKRLAAWIPANERYTTINLYEVTTGKEVVTFNDAGRNVSAVGFSPDGARAATGARDGTVRVYEIATKQLQPGGDWFLFERGVGVGAVALGEKVLVGGGDNGEVKIADAGKRQVMHAAKGHAQKVTCCALSADGRRAATAGLDSVVILWDTATGRELRRWDMRTPLEDRGGFVAQLAFAPDGRHLLTANANTTLYMLDLP